MPAFYPSFGRTTPPGTRAVGARDAMARLESGGFRGETILPYGNGRSYGDTCQADDGTLVDMRGLNQIVSLDTQSGLIVAEAGVLLSRIIAHAAPHGFFPPVVPGTQFVTLGGAIANDVHGKNHHRRGTFGCHVEQFELLRSDGRTCTCSATTNAQLFAATIGGMGLTGIILSASLRLMRVPSLDIDETITPFDSLDRYFDLAERADEDNEYAVAWLDQLAGGNGAGRGLLIAGNHAAYGSKTGATSGSRLGVPVQPPFNVLNRPFLKAFNAAYRWQKVRARNPHTSGYQGFFFPLDGVADWNRLYGPKGLHQHQSVIPGDAARATIPLMLKRARDAGQGSFLTVLKRFGSMKSPGILSFPRPGYTLTLDFPNRGAATLSLLDELDAMTVGAGGAVNPYKDARMSPATFAASFPDWQRLEAYRDPAFASRFWTRTAMRPDAARAPVMSAAE